MRSAEHCLCIVDSTDFTETLTFAKNAKWIASMQEDLFNYLQYGIVDGSNIA